MEYSKSIVPQVSLSFAGGYVNVHPPGGPNASGWKNIEITPTWQFLTDVDRELVGSVAMSFEMGGSGSSAVADKFTTYTPKILFGKGFGDLPDSMSLLRPFAVTGVIGYALPATSTASKSIEWSGALEYSLLYLQANVRNQGISGFVSRLTPVVEFSLSTPTETGGGGTTGTINPGLIWSGQYTQVGAEAIVPGQSGLRRQCRRDDATSLLSGRPLPALVGNAVIRGQPLKASALVLISAIAGSPAPRWRMPFWSAPVRPRVKVCMTVRRKWKCISPKPSSRRSVMSVSPMQTVMTCPRRTLR